MDIEKFEFIPHDKGEKKPSTVGMNVLNEFGKVYVNLFALSDNEGALVRDNIWDVVNQIIEERFEGKVAVEDIDWTFNTGHFGTKLKFETLYGQPAKIDILDTDFPFHHEEAMRDPVADKWSAERYSEEYFGSSAFHKSEMRPDDKGAPGGAKTVFTIPCDHPAVPNGIFYCHLGDMHYHHDNQSDLPHFIADTQKYLASIEKRRPGTLQHAKDSLWPKETLKEGDVYNSIVNSRGTNPHYYSFEYEQSPEGLFQSGQAEVVEMIRQLDLPFVPIAIEKGPHNEEELEDLRRSVGYKPQQTQMKLDNNF